MMSVLNKVHVSPPKRLGNKESKLQTLTSTTGTTPVINSVCLTGQSLNVGIANNKIHIPASILQQAQLQAQQQQQQQNMHTSPMIVTTTAGDENANNKLATATDLSDFLKKQMLNQAIHKSSSYPMATNINNNNVANSSLPFIFTAAPTKLSSSGNGLNLAW